NVSAPSCQLVRTFINECAHTGPFTPCPTPARASRAALAKKSFRALPGRAQYRGEPIVRARLLACVCVTAVAALTGCARPPESGLERVRRAGVLRWGGDQQGGEPYAYEDPTRPGHLVGFEVELAEALARALGVRAEFVQNDWSTLVPSLERGTFDVVLNGLEVTPARAGRIDFSRPYFVFDERLVTRAADPRAPAGADLPAAPPR